MKRSEQIVELMDDVKKIISQMAVADVCEKEKKPVEVGKTIMTSREVADMFQEYHSVTYRRIAQLIVELVEDAESGYKDVRELFNQFITGPKGENREIPELTQAYERLRAVMEAQVPGAKADTAITSAVYDVAIESEMQGFIYGFQLFGAVLQGCGNTRKCAGEN